METRERDTAQKAAPRNDWWNAEIDHHLYASANLDDDDDDDEDEEEEDDEAGDWGHVDPAEGNSPFPDSNDPSGPGSAV